MPRSGGIYTLPQPAFIPNTTISSSAVNSDLSDIATALTQSIATNGQTAATGAIQFATGTGAAPSITFSTDTGTGLYSVGSGTLGVSAGGQEVLAVTNANIGTGKSGTILSNVFGGIHNPVGAVVSFAGSTAPTGWQLCYGQSLSTTSYPELFFVIGYTYGGSGGSFFLPDMRGRASFGQDNMGGTAANRITVAGTNFDGTVLGNSGGGQSQTLSQANLPNVNFTNSGITLHDNTHFHTVNSVLQNSSANLGSGGTAGFSVNNISTTAATANISVSAQGSAASGGIDAPFSVLSPAVIFNVIIYSGRP